MPRRRMNLLDRAATARARRFWARAADAADLAPAEDLRGLRGSARRLAGALDTFLRRADDRLALPLAGSNAMNRPLGADWLWRPPLWREANRPRGHVGPQNGLQLGPGIRLFHDCPLAEIVLRQERNRREADLAPFGLRIEVLEFGGSFLSLAIELPGEAIAGLQRRHLFQAAFDIEAERQVKAFARIKVKHGPNTEEVTRELPVAGGVAAVDFDLAYTKVNEARVEAAWLDVIFEAPALNAIRLRDLVLSRRPRAEL